MQLKRHILELLKRVGLSDNEAKFYIAVYQNPKLTIKDLQELTGLSKSSAYRAFEHLKELKLLTSSPGNWRKNVEAVSLKTLADKVGKQQRQLRRVELELKSLDNLMNLTSFNDVEDPIEILKDKNQIIEKCYEILHRPWKHMFCYGSAERLMDVIGNDPERDFVRIRSKKGKTCDALLTELGEYTKDFIPNNQKDLRNMRLRIDPNNQDCVTYIYEDEVTVWNEDENAGKRAIVIKEPTLVKTYKNQFKVLWDKG